MRNQTVSLFVYSSMAIVALILIWGFRQTPQQRDMANHVLRSSLEQELITFNSGVKAGIRALNFEVLDAVKSEREGRFAAVALLEWDHNQWRIAWMNSARKSAFQAADVVEWVKAWPLAKVTPGETYFFKVGESEGRAHFAALVPLRKPQSNKTFMGIGVFAAQEFGLNFSTEHSREVKVFDSQGYALALNHQAYLGTSVKRDPLVEQMFEGDEVSARREWDDDSGRARMGVAARVAGSNLTVAVEAPVELEGPWVLRTWVYLILCGMGAIGLNWLLLNSLVRPLLQQISHSDAVIEQLKRQRIEPIPQAGIRLPAAPLEELSFVEPAPSVAAPVLPKTSLGKVVSAALRSLEGRMKEAQVKTQLTGLDGIEIHGDVLQIQTAIEEVLKNSIEALAGSSEKCISLHAETKDGRTHLSIADTGPGFSTEGKARAFEPFFTTKASEGLSRGLGLNVARRVLEELGGQIKVANKPADQGALVELTWPLMAQPQVQSSPVVELQENDDFEHMIMHAPLIPTRSPE